MKRLLNRMKLMVKKIWCVANECIGCFKNRIDPRFLGAVILKKFHKYVPIPNISENKGIHYLPASLKPVYLLLSGKYDVKWIYDIFVSFFFYADFVPKEGWVILDAGAYKGLYTELCAHLVGRQKGRILAVEPNPNMCSLLWEKFGNMLYSNVKVIKAALGKDDKAVILYLPRDFSSVSSVFENHVQRFAQGYDVIATKCYSIDELVEKEKITNLDLVKLDIEGAELNALLGATNAMGRNLIKRFIIEVHEDIVSIREITKLLSKYHYKIKVVTNTSAIIRRYIYAKACS